MDWWAGCGLWTGTAVTEKGWPGESPSPPCLWASGAVPGVGPARGGSGRQCLPRWGQCAYFDGFVYKRCLLF